MLGALAADFAAISGTVHTILDPHLPLSALEDSFPANVVVHRATRDLPLWTQWIQAARGCDAALVVAPETGGMLAQSVAMLHAAGLEMLNGFGDFLRCASDKWETARLFHAAGVPHPPTWLGTAIPRGPMPPASRWVVKPRDGCGTIDVRLFSDLDDAIKAVEGSSDLLQPWVEGRAVSISAIVVGNEITLLPAVSQAITLPRLSYQGGAGPLDDQSQQRASALAQAALRSLPRSIRGVVGFDLVLADLPAEDCVIEVNPRVTTSYIGLRKIVAGNLAQRIVGLDRSPVQCTVLRDSVRWTPEGVVWIEAGVGD